MEILQPCEFVLGRLDVWLVYFAGVWTLEVKLDVLSLTGVLGAYLDIYVKVQAFLGVVFLGDDHFFDFFGIENSMELAGGFLLGQWALWICQ